MLPIVKEEIGFTIQEEFRNSEGSDYICETLERMGKENPCIANFIAAYSLQFKEEILPIMTCAVLVYRLLESQAEADSMEKEFRQ
ncbi:MAG: hypothetical protein AAB920_00905 [Patescibacteria group bacterium]